MNFHTSRRVILGSILFLASWAVPSNAQVWVDATELGGRVPEWVDAKYYQPTAGLAPAPVRSVWVEPVYRITCKQVWHEPVYQLVRDRAWVEGHYIVVSSAGGEPCEDPTIRYLHSSGRVWIPGHYETIQRRICISPGHWETVRFNELVTPGHWETIARRD
jgi:hypothetical protein